MTSHPALLDNDLALPLDIDSERWAVLSRGVLWLGCLVFVSLLTLAAIAPVREVATAEGQLTTTAPVVVVEHLDGGQVAEILITPGAQVPAGAPILRLMADSVDSDLAQIHARRAHQMLQRERLIAHVEGRAPEFSTWRADFPGLVREQRALFAAESAALSAEATAMADEIAELDRERDAAAAQSDSLTAQLSHARAQADIQQALLDRGLATRSRVLDAVREVARIEANAASVQKDALAALRAVSEVRRTHLTRSTERLQAWSTEITELSAGVAELDEAAAKARGAQTRLEVRAPVAGVVHALDVTGVGEVLAPGDSVATIVPADSRLIAEVRIDPGDIGFVEVGSHADITVTTFDRESFGALSGEVLSLSPTTFETPEGAPYYLARLALDRDSMSGATATGALAPGMVVRADIRTGEKSILRYLMKPIVRALGTAFSER